MLKFKDVPQEHTAEVVRLAAEMQMREEAQQMEKEATVAAAEEVGISEEYLQKASQELQARRIAEAKTRRRRNQLIGGVAAAAVVGGAVFGLTRPPAPFTVNLSGPTAITQRVSEGTIASVTREGNSAALTVQKFAENQQGTYYANLEVSLPQPLDRYKQISFNVRGDGPQQLRLDLEAGQTRWKGPTIQVSSEGQRVTLDFNQFQRQVRAGNEWKNVNYQKPGDVQKATFKTGDTINPPDTPVNIRIENITVE